MDGQSLKLDTDQGVNFGSMNLELCCAMVSFKLYQNFLDDLREQRQSGKRRR